VNEFLQVAVFVAAVFAVTPLFGGLMVRVFHGEKTAVPLGWLERMVYRFSGVNPDGEMKWTSYVVSLLVFNGAGIVLLLAIQMLQASLPLNSGHLDGVPFALALNTAVSFVTNTNWQAYSGEATMSLFTQMAGLAVQNFLSAATGIAVAVAVTRGVVHKSSGTLGNFWADLVRATLYVLLPLSFLLAVIFLWQGVPQTLESRAEVVTLSGGEQVIPLGPVASQVAIKQVGTNGGGFYGVNAAHPFENPTPLTNFLQMLAIFAVPAGLTSFFGRMTGDRRQGWVLFGVMLALFLAGFAVSWWAESRPNPSLGLAVPMEGKEVRFGVMNSVLFSTATTDASCGAVNAMHDSLSPLAGGVALLNMLLGEVVFGGVGAGLYGILLFVVLTVFLAGLMVGRTPEYLGKKLESREIRWAVIGVLAPCVCILTGLAVACAVPAGSATLGNQGPHGFSEMFYAFASAAANNGSAFGGLGVNNDFYNAALAVCMFLGRFAVIIPVLAVAGGLAAKKTAPPSPGTFPTHGATFGVLLIAVIVIVGALTFFPALCLGPVAEHLLLLGGRTF